MAGRNWLAQLQKNENAVKGDYNPYKHVVRFPSPSMNFLFGGPGHGLPMGYSAVIAGPPKGGKSVICNGAIGQLHQDDPEAFVIKYDTEGRESGQLTDQQASLWGIDRNRYQAFSTNTPEGVFDHFEKDLGALAQEGCPIKLVVIDSITGLQGRRSMNADSISVMQIGDLALTLQEGFKRILNVQRRHHFALLLTCHVRAEMDPLEVKRGNKIRMALPFGVAHYAEYFLLCEPNRNKEGRTDLAGNEFRDEDLGDMAGKGDQTAHKIRVKMKDSSLGAKGRTAEFTLDYNKGITNTFEEAFVLGTGRGVIQRPNNLTYQFGDQKWTGKPATLEALKNNPAMCTAIIKEVFDRDQPGTYDDEADQVEES